MGRPLLDQMECLVQAPGEWGAALAGVNSAVLPGPLASPDLWQEAALLEKLLYKNSSQHRGAHYFRHLVEVRRVLRLLGELRLSQQVQALHEALHAAKQQRGGSGVPTYGAQERRLPTHQAAAGVLQRLRAACALVEQLAPAVHCASSQLLAQLAHSFFMPLCLTCLACLARIQVLAAQLLLDAVRAYNCLAEAAVLLPLRPDSGTEAAAEDAGGSASLPQLLRSSWQGGVPRLEAVACAPGEGLPQQAAAAARRYGIQSLAEHERLAAAAAAAMHGPRAAALTQRGPATGGQRKQAAAAAPLLLVVEDRGVAISRESLLAARAQPSSATAAAAVVVGGPAPGLPAPAAAAAGEQQGSGKDRPLLHVVEDAAAPETAPLEPKEEAAPTYFRSTMRLGGAWRPGRQQPVPAQPAEQPHLSGQGGSTPSTAEEAVAGIAASAGAVGTPAEGPLAAAEQQEEQPGAVASARAAAGAAAAEQHAAGTPPMAAAAAVTAAAAAAAAPSYQAYAGAAALGSAVPQAAPRMYTSVEALISRPKQQQPPLQQQQQSALLPAAVPDGTAASAAAAAAAAGVEPLESTRPVEAGQPGTAFFVDGSPSGDGPAAVQAAAQPAMLATGMGSQPAASASDAPSIIAAAAAAAAAATAAVEPAPQAAATTATPPLPLDLGAKKRKRPNPSAQQQQAALAAAEASRAPNSWEDWLAPLGQAPATGAQQPGTQPQKPHQRR